ncbi:trypsin-like peptidase domain-containing protein [Streptomyces sp. bgisy022]|uniref:trypsin-like peptidase domain-containing protein n=1 Tax=Streptomyces sp. bgisy022 TaxID=3413769 RepID=UPI003D7484F4
MRQPLVVALCALALAGVGATPAVAAGPAPTAPDTTVTADTGRTTAPDVVDGAAATVADAVSGLTAPRAAAVNFAGTVALSNCSGSVVRMPDSAADAPALVLTNGHCLESGFPAPGQVLVDRPSSRTFGLLNASGSRVATLRAERLVYATMTDTDAAVYRLNRTYGQIRSAYGIDALTLNDTRPTAGTAISVVSGYWKRIYNCSIDGFVHRMQEGDWTWKDSVRYTPSCNTIGGTSGSPVVDAATGRVVAVNNTGNEDGQRCTVNNPCEIDEQGRVTVRQGINYAQQTYWFPGCFGADSRLELNTSGCVLPKP